MYIIWFVFLYETGATESYTYSHTLSLHDALPIYTPIVSIREGTPNSSAVVGRSARARRSTPTSVFLRSTVATAAVTSAIEHRSEENTSELQSLMRNSYVVFCLNTTI